MSGSYVVYAELELDREIKQYRSWWAKDSRIAGNALTVLLYYRSFGPGSEVTQQQAMDDLRLRPYAFRTAKERLRRAGFLVEVRDRYPASSRAPATGAPRGGQPRYQLWFFDPAPDTEVSDEYSLIVSTEPLENENSSVELSCSWKPSAASKSVTGNQQQDEKPLFSTVVANQRQTHSTVDNFEAVAGNQRLLKEDTGLGRLVGSLDNSIPPTNRTGDARAVAATQHLNAAVAPAGVDAQLEALAPGCGLTYAALALEVQGRIDLSLVDVVAATRDTLLRAKSRVARPAGYVAAVIVRKPEAWPVSGSDGQHPYEPILTATELISEWDREAGSRESCRTGNHDWGPEKWGELARAACVWCSISRRIVDPTFAEFEEENDPSGDGKQWGA